MREQYSENTFELVFFYFLQLQYHNYTATGTEFTVVNYDRFCILILYSYDTYLVITVRTSHPNLRRGGNKSSPTGYVQLLKEG